MRRSDSHKKHPKQPSQLHSPAVVINTVYVPPPPVTQSAPSFTPRHHILGSGPPQPPPVVPNPQLSLAGKRKERSDMIEDLMLGTEDESDKRMKITAVDFDSI